MCAKERVAFTISKKSKSSGQNFEPTLLLFSMTEDVQLTPDEQLRADILSICSALGAMEEYQTETEDILTKYAMGDECLCKYYRDV